MVAKVRIAPVEKWCPVMQKINASLSAHAEVGAEISIDTSTMKTNGGDGMVLCDGRCWRVVAHPTDVHGIDVETQGLSDIDGEYESSWVCEHVLEMD